MALIDFGAITQATIAMAKGEVGKAWTKLKPYAEHEFAQFAENAAFLAKLKLDGNIEDDELKARLSMQGMALKNVLLAIKGIGLVSAQNVVNGAFDIVSKALKKAINVVLPIPI